MISTNSSELHPAGFELFQDSESFLNELSDTREIDSLDGTSATLVVSIADGAYGLNIGFNGREINPK